MTRRSTSGCENPFKLDKIISSKSYPEIEFVKSN